MRVLIWNVKFFTISVIQDQRSPEDTESAKLSLDLIVNTVQQSGAEVFVVLEPRASAGQPGSLVGTDVGGASGLLHLLGGLRATMQAADWRLVPPLRINETVVDVIQGGSTYTECVGVFWSETALTFTGPWVWTADGPRPAGTPALYPDTWQPAVPNGTTAAGQCVYPVNDTQLLFPEVKSRRPFTTTFREKNAPNREMRLISVHNDLKADAATRALAQLNLTSPANTFTLVAGDFNIDLSAQSTLDSGALSQMRAKLGPLFPPAGFNFSKAALSYTATTFVPAPNATRAAYVRKSTYDYGFVGYGQGAAPNQPLPRMYVVNRVAGSPDLFTTAMHTPLAGFDRYAQYIDPDLVFRRPQNYGQIPEPRTYVSNDGQRTFSLGTSDHLPVLFEV